MGDCGNRNLPPCLLRNKIPMRPVLFSWGPLNPPRSPVNGSRMVRSIGPPISCESMRTRRAAEKAGERDLIRKAQRGNYQIHALDFL